MNKKINTILILLAFQCNVYAQEIIWDKCNGAPYYYLLNQAPIEDSSGNIYFLGTDSTTAVLDKYDSNIEQIWHVEADSNERFINFIDDDHSYFTCKNIGDSLTVIRKYDSNKILVWNSDTIHQQLIYIRVKKTKSGGYLFAQGFAKQSYVTYIDNTGKIKWKKRFYEDFNGWPFQFNYVFDFIETSDNKILTIENFYNYIDSWGGSQDDFITLKQLIDSSGNILQSDTSLLFPSNPSNFTIDFIYNYPFFTKNTSSYYPEFYSTLYYNKDQLVFKVTDANLNVITVDTIKNYIDMVQENLQKKITDSSYFLLLRNTTDSLGIINGGIEFMLYNIKGEKKWNYIFLSHIHLNDYNAVINQLSDKKYLVELNDYVTHEIHRFLIDDFQLKWHTVSIDSTIKNNYILYATITPSHQYNSSSNPTSIFNYDNENNFYKIQQFTKQADSIDYPITSYIYTINLQDGSTQRFMQTDSFGLIAYYGYSDIKYGINFFKVLPDNKLFLSTITNRKCIAEGGAYLLILGSRITSVKNEVNKNTNGKMSIFPNPNTGVFTVSFENKGNSTIQLQLTDVTGALIFNESRQHQNKTAFTIDESNLAKGIYWIKLSDGNDVYSSAVIVQ